MLHGGIVLYTNDDYEFEYAIPMLYNNNEWKETNAYVYMNGQWRMMGAAGCPMVYWYDEDGKMMIGEDGKFLLVRDMKDLLFLYTNDTGYKIKDSTGRYIRLQRPEGR